MDLLLSGARGYTYPVSFDGKAKNVSPLQSREVFFSRQSGSCIFFCFLQKLTMDSGLFSFSLKEKRNTFEV